MKFRVTMKTPDALANAIHKASLDYAVNEGNKTDEDVMQEMYESTERLCERWFKYREIVTLEIDTEKKTCTVVEN